MKRRRWLLAGAVVLLAAAATGGVVATSGATQPTGAAPEPVPSTAPVERGKLSDTVSQYGVLTYQARPDGSPYAVINQSSGTYTKLPEVGDRVGCGQVLYRVDDEPVLLLCGSTPAYRSLSQGDSGPDVTELNANLVHLGYAAAALLDPDHFGPATASALEKLQGRLGDDPTGSLDLGRALFLPEPVRVAKVTGELGGPARSGTHVLDATSDRIEVQVALDPSQRDQVTTGDAAEVTLPDNTSVRGRVDRLGSAVEAPARQQDNAAGSTIPAYISLDDPDRARGLEQAPVQVSITTHGVDDVLNVPVTAIVGTSGGGFGVEVVRGDGRRRLVTVTLGLVDTTAGRVQVDGDLRVGDRVVVASS